ncbi:MAG: CvpA family protein [Holosporales bacterium]|jgi:membrane protein required for colicin V production|nr:CvpA family protein [Holosporales bacterium]
MGSLGFSAVDTFIVATVVVSFIIGWVRGVTKEVLSVVSWVLGIYLSITLFPHVKDFARERINHGLMADFVTVCALFILFLTMLSALNYFCSNMIKNSILNTPDKALGGLFGIIRAIVILVIIDLGINQFVLTNPPEWLNQSRLRPILNNISNCIILVLPEDIQDQLLAHLSQLKKQSLLDFVKNDLIESFASDAVENIIEEGKQSIAIDGAQEVKNGENEDETQLDVNTADSDQSTHKTRQTAEELATLKPKKMKPTPDGQGGILTKRGKLDMERILNQYDDVDEE